MMILLAAKSPTITAANSKARQIDQQTYFLHFDFSRLSFVTYSFSPLKNGKIDF